MSVANENQSADVSDIYPLISAVSVLEAYLQLAKQYGLLKDTRLLNGELDEVKRILERLAGR
jgi:hypothetical protein